MPSIYLYTGEANPKNIRLNDPTSPIFSYARATEAASASDTASSAISIHSLVTGFTLGTLRSNYNNFVGFQFQVGALPLTVTKLGRMMISGNIGTHLLKLSIAGAVAGNDVPGGSVSVNMLGGTPGQYVYGALAIPVVLAAGTSYILFSLEVDPGGDQWGDDDTTITATPDVSLFSAAYVTGTSNVNIGSPGQTYGPLNLLYSTSATYSVSLVEAASAAASTTNSARFAVSRTEAVSAIDAPTETIRFSVSRSETASAVDAPVGNGRFPVTRIEAASAVDAATSTRQLIVVRVESVSALDSPTSTVKFSVTRTEAASALDVPGATAHLGVSRTEAASALDVPAATAHLNVARAEAASASDAPTSVTYLFVSRTEGASASDQSSAGARFAVSRIEAAMALDHSGTVIHFNVSQAENASAADAVSALNAVVVACAEGVTAQDAADAVYTYFWYRSYRPGSQYRLYRGDPAYKQAVPVSRVQPVGIPR